MTGSPRLAVALAGFLLTLPARSGPVVNAVPPPGASSCTGCHALRPLAGQAVPPIAGRPIAEIVDAMAAFRAGERPATVMTRIARGFSPDETRTIADWLEQQP